MQRVIPKGYPENYLPSHKVRLEEMQGIQDKEEEIEITAAKDQLIISLKICL